MNSRQIESWALRVIDCVKNGQPHEDFLVELKRDWIEPGKAARRIAGHANAARGESILWLIGLDEKDTKVTGANPVNMASWYSSVESCFNELTPRMTPLNVPIDGVVVVALLFETDRAPFVFKNPQFGKQSGAIALEVPWRENTSTRSACRADLIRLLTPLEKLPEVEILSMRLEAILAGERGSGNYHPNNKLIVSGDLYIVPENKNRIVIPFHRCRVDFKVPGFEAAESSYITLDPASGSPGGLLGASIPGSVTVKSTLHEVIIEGPGRVSFTAIAKNPPLFDIENNFEVEVLISLKITDSDRAVILKRTLSCPISSVGLL